MSVQKRNLLFERAGTLMLRRRLSSGLITTDNAEIYVANKPSIKEMSFSVSKEMQNIDSGNSNYPADIRPIKTGTKLAITMNAFDRQLFRFAAGMQYRETTSNAYATIIGEEHVIDATEGTVAITDKTVKANGLMVIKDYATGMPYATASGDTPSENEYAFASATNTFTFNDADKGKKVIISYDALAGSTSEDYMSATPVDYTYEAIIMAPVGAFGTATDEQYNTMVLDSVKFSGEISPPKRANQSSDWTINLEITEPFGTDALTMKYVNKADFTAFSAG
mgnify:CR=1 FL=1